MLLHTHTKRFALAAVGAAALLGPAVAGARAALVGPGFSVPGNAGDTVNGSGSPAANGTRNNIDQTVSVLLPAGQYSIQSFQYDAQQAGQTQPFLAFRPGADGNTYQVLAVGALRTIAAAAQDQSVAFGGTNTFTLLAPTTVYAGIYTPDQQTNPVALQTPFGTAGLETDGTDHDSSPTAPVIAGTVGGFSNPNLNRRYAFALDVVPVPEPTMLGAVGVGALGLLARRRRR